jgi:hypothetical protein
MQLFDRQPVSSLVKSPPTMNHKPPPHDDSWESDAVWKLLDQAAPMSAGPRFAEDTTRLARLAGQPVAAWWQRLLTPLWLGGMAAAAAAVAITVIALQQTNPTAPVEVAVGVVNEEPFAEMQELAETEALSAAVDHLEDFTDSELVCLIGL